MSAVYNLLQLHLSQAELALHKAKNNSYSDQRKEAYHAKLNELFEAVLKDVIAQSATLTDKDIYTSYKQHVDFIFKSLEFLDSSTLNQIPYEIVECLNYAMQDWLLPTDKYIIVTSLSNNVEMFSFEGFLAFYNNIYDDILARYGIVFEYRLVQINLPKALNRDYLASMVLYHELGHFIDSKLKICQSATFTLINDITNSKYSSSELSQLKIFLASLDIVSPSIKTNETLKVFYHLSEYFCDIFASQYVGESSNYYLTYITENKIDDSEEHPSTINRVKVVSDFLNGTDNIIVTLLNTAVTAIKSGQQLEQRFTTIPPDDIFSLLPVNINSPEELHGVFDMAWKVWLNNQPEVALAINSTAPLKLYKVVNNLVEKSIGNYITQKKWNQAKTNPTPTVP